MRCLYDVTYRVLATRSCPMNDSVSAHLIRAYNDTKVVDSYVRMSFVAVNELRVIAECWPLDRGARRFRASKAMPPLIPPSPMMATARRFSP